MSKKREYPKLTIQHFEFIAHIINKFNKYSAQTNILIEIFTDELKKTNPKFNSEKFIKACLK